MTNTSIALNAYPGPTIVGSPVSNIGSVSTVASSADAAGIIGSIYIAPNTLRNVLQITGDVLISEDSDANASFHVLIAPSGAEASATEIWTREGRTDGNATIERPDQLQRRPFNVFTDNYNVGSTTAILMIGSANELASDDSSVWQLYTKALTY